jgi:lipid II:glycine glycyltransferase (peptidoglycan interpeptide bridge formation enzyme)
VQHTYDRISDVGDQTGVRPELDSVWQVEVDHATPDEWSRMLDLFEDANLYQTWPYGKVRWGRKNLSHLVLKRNDEIVAMAQLRIVRPTRLNFGMAYLRWGPLCHRRGGALDAEVAMGMARALHQEYVCKRRLFLQILPNAFVESPRAVIFQSAFSGFTTEPRTSANLYRTFVLDLTPPLEELRRNLDKKWRNQLTRAEKNGLKVVAGIGTEAYRAFVAMYNQMRSRKTFETTVNVEEFEQIQEALPETQRMRILICEREGVPVAGVVASAMGNSAVYVLGATSDGGLDAKGSYLLQWTLVQWLKESGVRAYDLGGIDPQKNPGVYHFKSGLSGTDVCQMTPVVASNSVVSSAFTKSIRAAHNAVRGLSARPLSRAFNSFATRS